MIIITSKQHWYKQAVSAKKQINMRAMKTIKFSLLFVSAVSLMMLTVGCTKNNADISSLYVPTAANVTAGATLQELQLGRALYIDNCGSCHALFSPDNYSATRWRNYMNSMAPKTTMSPSEILLVTKYVTKGN